MAKTANLNIRIDPDIKEQAEQLFSRFGITTTDAVNIFLHQCLNFGGIPLELKVNKPNAETIAAMEEADRISRDPSTKRYSNFSELLAEVQNEI